MCEDGGSEDGGETMLPIDSRPCGQSVCEETGPCEGRDAFLGLDHTEGPDAPPPQRTQSWQGEFIRVRAQNKGFLMHQIIAWFARNGVAANLLMLAILMAGINTLFKRIPTEVFPEFELDMITVSVP